MKRIAATRNQLLNELEDHFELARRTAVKLSDLAMFERDRAWPRRIREMLDKLHAGEDDR